MSMLRFRILFKYFRLPAFYRRTVFTAFICVLVASQNVSALPYPVPHQTEPISLTAFKILSPVTEQGGFDPSQLPPKPLTFSLDCSYADCMALTFDDGPDPITTSKVLDILKKYHINASFFVIGNKIAGNEVILQRMHAEGNEIGNHSWEHKNFTKLTAQQITQQIDMTQNALRTAGVPEARMFRPPYGAFSRDMKQHISLPIALWNIDPKDWHETNTSSLVDNLVAKARPGGIIVMHDTREETVNSLEEIISQLNKKYQLVTLSELVHIREGARSETVIY